MLDWIEATTVDEASVRRRAGRRFARSESRAEPDELQRIIRTLDLTSLRGDESQAAIRRLCAKARAPLPEHPAGGKRPVPVRVAAVCVFPDRVALAARELQHTGVPVAAACGFPAAASPLSRRCEEVRVACAEGAGEVDAVIDCSSIHRGAWDALHAEVLALRVAADGALLKVILRTGELRSSTAIARAGLASMMGGADFLKTSTGFDRVNATPVAGIVLADVIRSYHERVGWPVGLKPAGGIRRAEDARKWLRLAAAELGPRWTEPGLFRIGASGLLGSLRKELGRTAARRAP